MRTSTSGRLLDGEHADEVRAIPPAIEYVFQNIAAGQHIVEVQDVVGYDETAEVVVPVFTVPPSPLALSAWLAGLVHKPEKEPVANPPELIEQYQYGGQTVYFLAQRCCDIFGDLYGAKGDLIGHPDGGIMGQRDGRVPDFLDAREYERTI